MLFDTENKTPEIPPLAESPQETNIFVVDAIMGSGKSESAISFMNAHPDRRFIYVTPYLSETERIKDSCPLLDFVLPNNKIPEHSFSKYQHTRELIEQGRNIASTHTMLRKYTDDFLELIKAFDYTLIIDEAVDVFTETNFSIGDVDMLVDGKFLERTEDFLRPTGKAYSGTRLYELHSIAKCNNLIPISKGKNDLDLYYWAFPKEILFAFREVYVLTYMFHAQDLRYFFDINKIQYNTLGVRKDEDNTFNFSPLPCPLPPYVKALKDHIHIFNNERLNHIGRNRYALSLNWYKNRKKENMVTMKNNLINYFRNYNGSTPAENKLWACYESAKNVMKGQGYASGYLAFNTKASNQYRHKTVLAYPVNIFAKPEKALYFYNCGVPYDDDAYALSTMVQWIWRSAIRDGKDISIYIPSRRMRDLLTKWLDEVSKGEENE